ncbi:MAG: NifU family protein [bacterium]|nr:NifU family protein [bacterium]
MSLPKERDSQFEKKLLKALGKVRAQLKSHGGDVRLVGVKGSKATIKILGACLGCPQAQMTFGEEMEEFLKEEVPELKTIKFVI